MLAGKYLCSSFSFSGNELWKSQLYFWLALSVELLEIWVTVGLSDVCTRDASTEGDARSFPMRDRRLRGAAALWEEALPRLRKQSGTES